MTSLSINFYNNKPSNNELVLVVFTNLKESYAEGMLCDYPYELFMTFSDATKKRKVSSYKNIIPLNKPIVARVDDANYGSNIVQVSLCYIYEDKTNNDIDTKRKILLEPFIKNKILVSIFTKISIETDRNIDDMWSNIVYPIDELRRSEYEIEDMPMLLDYCLQEKESIKDIFEENKYDDIYMRFEELIDKTIEEKPCKLISNINIISTGGIHNTKILLNKIIDKIKFEYTLKYITGGLYAFESHSIDSSKEDHDDIIQFLIKEANIFEPKIFIKCTEIAKKV
jgi:translation initiation factor 2 alpha subunit (eIF-2alpha)